MDGHARMRKTNQEAFLIAFAIDGSVTAAAKQCGVTRRLHYTWLVEDPTYRERYERAKEMYKFIRLDMMQEMLWDRGFNGWREPIIHGGEVVDYKWKVSDTIAIFLAKSLDPDRYRENVAVNLRQDNEERGSRFTQASPEAMAAVNERLKNLSYGRN
jgi:hypothetical protein